MRRCGPQQGPGTFNLALPPIHESRRHERLAQCLCGLAVEAGDGLGVEVEGESAAGVAEASLSGLYVDAGGDEPGGVGSAEVVEGEARKS